jgi:hypothetical protein
VAFHDPRKTPTLCRAYHIYALPHLKQINMQDVAHFMVGDVFSRKFAQLPNQKASRLEMPLLRFCELPWRNFFKTNLHCFIPITVFGANLRHYTWANFDHGYRNYFPCGIKDLQHA